LLVSVFNDPQTQQNKKNPRSNAQQGKPQCQIQHHQSQNAPNIHNQPHAESNRQSQATTNTSKKKRSLTA
jgi:hypothetical protein